MAQTEKEQSNIDYIKLGLKCGLEIHQQLDTGRKLFCRCKADLRLDEPQAIITRHMRPTLSELGEYDKAAFMEFKKKKEIKYEIHDSVCSYEIDETPPFELDSNAIDLAITIAKMLNMDIIDELHVNRKQYLDGSIPTGFQRTMIIGMGGKVKIANKTINLAMIALEEDSCREISNIGKKITWRVDRLGTPLVEIATKTIAITDPKEVKIIAEGIGRILRATGKVKRGLGTIRQDLNISIQNGARIEIKGVQILAMLPEYVKLEVERQLKLLEIRDELKKRKLKSQLYKEEHKDCKPVFEKTSCKFLKEAFANKHQILGIKLPGMNELLGKKIQAERTFGKELADRVKIITGLGGVIHSDELPNYGITQNEVVALRELFECRTDDAVIFVIGEVEDTLLAIKEIIIRIQEAFDGVPEETRHAVDDGTTSFRRYLGGAGRMYPDTDTQPIRISASRLKRIGENLPELPDKKEERYLKDYEIPEVMAKSLAISVNSNLFEELIKLGVEPVLAAVTIEQTMKALSRENHPVENLADKKIKAIFELLIKGKIAKEAIKPLLAHFANSPQDNLDATLKVLGLETITEEELLVIIKGILKTNNDLIVESGQRAKGTLMGLIMDQVRGKIDGKLVNQKFNKLFTKKLNELSKN